MLSNNRITLVERERSQRERERDAVDWNWRVTSFSKAEASVC